MGAQSTTADVCLTPEQCLLYLDGTASAPPRPEIELHLDRCSNCRIVLAEAARDSIAPSQAARRSSTSRTLAVGERLGERYEIRRFIGKGGMGEVYEALDLVLGEVIALKTLTLAAIDQADAFERMLTEVRAARRVTHVNVCRQFEFGVHRTPGTDGDTVPFLTMELLEGRTLAAMLAAEGPPPHRVALNILRDIAAGLAAIHTAGIVHRDMKSENVFLTRGAGGAPKAVVMDFGLALAPRPSSPRQPLQPSEGLVGTLDYMAPEQLQGQPVSPASDLYAFGVIAFELLSGELPFPRSASPETAAQRLTRTPPRAPDAARRLGPFGERLLQRCLAKDPAARPKTAAEVVALLEGAGHRTRRTRMILAAGLISGVALGLGLAWKGTRQSPAAPTVTVAPHADAAVQPAHLITPPPSIEPSPPVEAVQAPPQQSKHSKHSTRSRTTGRAIDVKARLEEDPLAPPRPRARHDDDLVDPFDRGAGMP